MIDKGQWSEFGQDCELYANQHAYSITKMYQSLSMYIKNLKKIKYLLIRL